MLPTLMGRLQTRILVLGILGSAWIVILGPMVPNGDATTGATYAAMFLVLAVVVVLGIGWEFLYHGVQQFRWEKDWPTLFGLLTAINEGVLVWIVVAHTGIFPADLRPPASVFLIQFITTWLIVWIVVNGPIRVVFPHWRFEGGRFI